jgi:hypothetical protein
VLSEEGIAMRAFLKKYLLEAIILATITGTAAGWLKGLASNLLPGTEGPRCWVEEQWRSVFGGFPRADPAHFTVLLARLDTIPMDPKPNTSSTPSEVNEVFEL